MKKIVFILLAFLIPFILPVKISAQAITLCEDVNFTPSPASPGELITITANCDNTDATVINIVVVTQEGEETGIFSRPEVNANGQLNTQISTPADLELGNYYILLLDPSRNPPANQLTEPLTLRLRLNEDTPSQKVCCSLRVTDEEFTSSISTIIQNEPNCVVPVGETGANACPSLCEAVSVNRPGINLCAGAFSGHRALCSTQGLAGIDSAIGCIPFETPDSTTAFFVRWSLGVGGGIALFLIAFSGIKIATTKGDPKKLQDARDTFSSAIAGLVLLILSVFVMRFLSETLLDLF